MRKIKNQFKIIILLFTSIILMQSCRVYKKESVTLENAVKEQKRVKIITNDNKKYKFKRVTYEDGLFYGINKKKGKEIKTQLNIDDLKKVRLHNKTMSIIYSTLLSLISASGIALIIALSSFDLDIELEGPILLPN
ncbi:MAG: hypothetical protein COA67_09585 [Lutibacter sp.]|nr:MAG: hypothetical protein COA67_09585 [Lutibacter sp.]